MNYYDLPVGAIYLKPLQRSLMIKQKTEAGSIVLDYVDPDREVKAREIAANHGEPNPSLVYEDDRS